MQQVSSNSIFVIANSNRDFDDCVFLDTSVTKISERENGVIYCFSTSSSHDKSILLHNLQSRNFLKMFENTWVPRGFEASSKSELVSDFFGYIADQYDSMISEKWNISCYEFLYSQVASECWQPSSVLDFGSGTGLIVGTDFYKGLKSVFGFDHCEAMRVLGQARGLVSLKSLNSLQRNSIDLIISCYVFHYGLSAHAFDELVSLLNFGGKLVANIHKDIGLISYVERCELLVRAGFKFEIIPSAFGSVLLLERLSE